MDLQPVPFWKSHHFGTWILKWLCEENELLQAIPFSPGHREGNFFSDIFGTLSANNLKKDLGKGSLSTYKDVSVSEHGVVGHGLHQVARGDKNIWKPWYRIIKEDYLRFVLNIVLLYVMFFEGTFKKRSILGKAAIQNTLNHSQLNRKQYMSLLFSCL